MAVALHTAFLGEMKDMLGTEYDDLVIYRDGSFGIITCCISIAHGLFLFISL